MTVRYHTRRGVEVPDYQCMNRCIQDGGPRCQTVPGAGRRPRRRQLLLETLTPLALEVALTVQAELDTRAAEADALRRQHVERARHHADLARRRYLAVDPDNRLVADSLEADWNDALRALQTAREDYDRASAAAAAALTDELKDRIRSLATDFPALWSNPDTPQRERKRIVRLLVDDVTLHKTDHIHLHVRFRGGQTTSLAVPIPPKAWQARQTDPDTLAMLDRLLDNHTDAETADALNTAGHRSGAGKPFTARIVLEARRSNKLPSHADRLRANGLLTKTELAARLGVHPSTVKSWTKRRNAQLPQGQRQERAPLRTTRPRRPPPHRTTRQPAQKTSSHPTRARRCTMKPRPCRRSLPTEPIDGSIPASQALAEPKRRVLGGFNRRSQHLDMEVSSGATTGVDGGADGACGDAFARSSAGVAAGASAGVLGGDRAGNDESGRRGSRWGVSGRGHAVVPRARRHAVACLPGAVGPVLVVCRAGGDRALARAGRRGPRDRPSAGPVAVDDLA